MSKPRECTSCKNGDKEFPDWAIWRVLSAPMEPIKLHGKSLCAVHADLFMIDWPEAKIELVTEWLNASEAADKDA